MEHTFETEYGTVVCKYFFEAEDGWEGLDISIDGEHVGEMDEGETIPDLDDADEVAKFEAQVTEWLSNKI